MKKATLVTQNKGKGEGGWKGKGEGNSFGYPFPGECWGCGETGHREFECPKGKGKSKGSGAQGQWQGKSPVAAVDESWGAASAWDSTGGEPEAEEGGFDVGFMSHFLAPVTVAPWTIVGNGRSDAKAANRPSGSPPGPPPGLERLEPVRTPIKNRFNALDDELVYPRLGRAHPPACERSDMHCANGGKNTSTSISTLRRQQEEEKIEEYAIKKELADMNREPTNASTTYSTYLEAEDATRGDGGNWGEKEYVRASQNGHVKPCPEQGNARNIGQHGPPKPLGTVPRDVPAAPGNPKIQGPQPLLHNGPKNDGDKNEYKCQY